MENARENADWEVSSKVSDVRERQQACLYGVLRSVTYPASAASGSFAATLLEVVWLGRKNVPGIKPGIRLAVQGMVISRANGLCVINPSFQISPMVDNER